MPVSITKSTVTEETINRMVKEAFGSEVLKTEELKEGYFNAAYKIRLKDRCVVLKIAPPKNIEIMTHEKNIMFSEVDSMRMAAKSTKVPVPEILFYDDSCTLLDREYFFMEMLKGQSLSSLAETLSEQQKQDIYYNIGKYTRMLNRIQGKRFGYYAQSDKQGDNWYEVFRSIISDTFQDAKRKDIVIPVERDEVLRLLARDRANFETVKTPSFVHWDIWDGNVFIADGKVEGIIDFERCLWADELMEVGFRTYGYKKAFFDGYGISKLSREEERRAKWYDIYVALIWCLESDYRGYENRDLYQWGCDMLKKWVGELNYEDIGGCSEKGRA